MKSIHTHILRFHPVTVAASAMAVFAVANMIGEAAGTVIAAVLIQ